MPNAYKNDNTWTLLFQCFPRDNDIATIDSMKKCFTDRAIKEAIDKGYIQYIGDSEPFKIPQFKITNKGIAFRNNS